MNGSWRIGIDTGGTFTDFVFYHRGRISIQKVPSTPGNPAEAILTGLAEAASWEARPFIVHGTTVATNALLERKGGRIALLTTAGFEDVIFIARQTRRELYRLTGETRSPLLPQSLCFGIKERITAGGKTLIPVSAKEIKELVQRMKRLRVDAAAVCLIHSYVKPGHEERVAGALEKAGIQTSVSSRILPEHREYERTTVTAVNAYLMPVISRYLDALENNLGRADLRIMQSNEGYISPATAKTEPIRTALSGPAGGVVAAFQVARASGYSNIITFDMGGTSSDVSLVPGHIQRSQQSRVGEFPIRLPMIDIHTVGAGGGSIAFVDSGGALRVGPQSAGANPGPACYGRGTQATVTDANLVLGRLAPGYFLGGNMKLRPRRSHAAVGRIAEMIGRSVRDTAAGIIEIANANMEKAIRVISIERGIDPRRFALLSFGGAGGMHSVEIASRLNIETVIIPKNAGVFSALGLLLADSIKDYSLSLLRPAHAVDRETLEKGFARMALTGRREMKREGFPESRISVYRSIDLRYQGQSHEITVTFRSPDSCIREFHKAHKTLYAYHHPEHPVEIVNLRVKAVGRSRKIKLPRYPSGGQDPKAAVLDRQDIVFPNRTYRAPVFDRALLEPGNGIPGPALIVDRESTTLLPPGFCLEVDPHLNLIIKRDRR
jgi:N-methylhydantoinase A/oxoprolinase/acetone carboxylase beta subunit